MPWGPFWTEDEDLVLKAGLRAELHATEIATKLGRSPKAIRRRAMRLGLVDASTAKAALRHPATYGRHVRNLEPIAEPDYKPQHLAPWPTHIKRHRFDEPGMEIVDRDKRRVPFQPLGYAQGRSAAAMMMEG